MKRYDDALAAIDRAIPLAYGPRTLRLMMTRADIQQKRGDPRGALATLKDAVARAKAMGLSPRYKPVLADLERRAHALETAPSP